MTTMIHPLHMQIDRNLDKNAAGVFILASCLCMKQPRVYKRWDVGFGTAAFALCPLDSPDVL